MDLGQPGGVRVAVGLGEQGGAFRIRGQNHVEQGLVPARGFLRHMAEPGAGGEADFPAIRVQVPHDRLEQGGLAGTVAADEADLAAVVDLQVRPFQQRPAGDADGQVADGKDGHGRGF